MLSASEIADYHKYGFVLLRGLFEHSILNAFNERFLDYANQIRKPAENMSIMKDVMVAKKEVAAKTPVHAINKLFHFENDSTLYNYALYPRLIHAVSDLLETEDLYSLVTNVFNKPPEVDGRHPLHQDLRYFQIRPADGIVGAWTAILPSSRESGCLAVIPGSHRGALLEHEAPDWDYVNFAFYGVKTNKADDRVHIEMQPGDTLLFHPLIIHGSGHNQTQEFRRAISAHFARGDCTTNNGNWKTGPQVRQIKSKLATNGKPLFER